MRQALLHLLTPPFFLGTQLVIAGVVPEVAVAVVKVTLFALLLVVSPHGVDDLVREGLTLLACQLLYLCVHACILVDHNFQRNHCYISLHLGSLAMSSASLMAQHPRPTRASQRRLQVIEPLVRGRAEPRNTCTTQLIQHRTACMM